jgi:hypothetical protein
VSNARQDLLSAEQHLAQVSADDGASLADREGAAAKVQEAAGVLRQAEAARDEVAESLDFREEAVESAVPQDPQGSGSSPAAHEPAPEGPGAGTAATQAPEHHPAQQAPASSSSSSYSDFQRPDPPPPGTPEQQRPAQWAAPAGQDQADDGGAAFGMAPGVAAAPDDRGDAFGSVDGASLAAHDEDGDVFGTPATAGAVADGGQHDGAAPVGGSSGATSEPDDDLGPPPG